MNLSRYSDIYFTVDIEINRNNLFNDAFYSIMSKSSQELKKHKSKKKIRGRYRCRRFINVLLFIIIIIKYNPIDNICIDKNYKKYLIFQKIYKYFTLKKYNKIIFFLLFLVNY